MSNITRMVFVVCNAELTEKRSVYTYDFADIT